MPSLATIYSFRILQLIGLNRFSITPHFNRFLLSNHSQIKHKQTMQELRQLQQENSSLEIKIRELTSSHNEMIQLRKDIQKLQQFNDVNNSKLNHLEEENESLRDRLRNVVQSPLSDNEKQQIIQDSQHRMHSSAPASIALPNVSSKISKFPQCFHIFQFLVHRE